MVRSPVEQCSTHHRQLLSLRSAHLHVSAVSKRTARHWSFSWCSEHGACNPRAAALNSGHRCRPMRGGEQASDTGDSAALSTACSISVMSTFSSGGGAAGRSFIRFSWELGLFIILLVAPVFSHPCTEKARVGQGGNLSKSQRSSQFGSVVKPIWLGGQPGTREESPPA